MPRRHELTNKEWERIAPLLPKRMTLQGRPRKEDRRMIDAMLWIMATGAPWRDLPESYGPWTTVYNRFRLWAKQGVWERVYQSVLESAERGSNVEFAAILEIDSTTCKAHQHAAGGKGGRKKTLLDDHGAE